MTTDRQVAASDDTPTTAVDVPNKYRVRSDGAGASLSRVVVYLRDGLTRCARAPRTACVYVMMAETAGLIKWEAPYYGHFHTPYTHTHY